MLGLHVLGCTGGSNDDNILNLALETSPNKLDPAFVIDVAEGQICSMIFQGLVRFSPEGEILPDAARDWEIHDGGLRYVFHLDPRCRYSDGHPVRAGDAVASFERVLSPTGGSPRMWVLERIRGADAYTAGDAGDVSGLSAPDDSTLVIELVKPFRPFLLLLAMPAACIVPVDAGDRSDFASRPVGSGRWQLKQWERGDYLLLDPNPYHPAGKPALSQLRFRIIPEAFTRVAEFESGQLDILEIPITELSRFLEDESLEGRIQSRPELRVAYVGLNNRQPPLDDVRVRRALNMAVDVDQLIAVLTEGQAIRAKGSIPPSLPGYRERPAYPYDPDEARRLLAQAGYPEAFSIDIWQRESPEGNRLVEAVQGYLARVGVEVRIVKREWSAFKEAVSQGRVDAFFLDWYADYPDGENFLFPLFHSQNHGGGGNRAFFENREVDRLIEFAQSTTDAQKGYELYARIDSLVYDAAPWIYLYFPRTFVAISPALRDYVYPVLYLGEDFASVTKSPKRRS